MNLAQNAVPAVAPHGPLRVSPGLAIQGRFSGHHGLFGAIVGWEPFRRNGAWRV